MIHDQGAYTPQGINLPYNASTAAARAPTSCRPTSSTCRWPRPTRSRPCRCAVRAIRKARSPWSACSTPSPRRLDLDRAEVRRRNLVPAEKMPYITPLKTRAGSPITIDSGDFPRCQRWRWTRSTMRASPRARQRARARPAISASASATGSRARAAGRSNPASCGSDAPAASRSTPARCRWGKASAPRSRKSAPSSSAFTPEMVTRGGRRYRGHSLRAGRLRQPADRHGGLRGAHRRGRGAREGARGRSASARSERRATSKCATAGSRSPARPAAA